VDADVPANLIAGGALVLSAVVAVRTEVNARRAGGQVAKADAAAERWAVALERMADQWAESLSRQEKMDRRQWKAVPRFETDSGWHRRDGGPWAGPAPQGPSEPVMHWTVDKVKGRQHILRNLGRATAYAVQRSADNAVRFNGPDEGNIEPSESLDFFAVGSMQTGTPELIVTWSDSPDGERREWRRPLP
jgi:hypothetical protein